MKIRKLVSCVVIFVLLSSLFCFNANAAPARMEPLSGTPFFYRERGETVTLMRCNVSAEGDVDIPAEINGKPVTQIEEFAFQNCTKIKSVIIPSTVTFVGWGAFNGCTAMETIFIPSSVQKFECSVFLNCTALKAAYIEDLTAWCQVDLDDEFSNPAYYTGKLTFSNGDVADLKIPTNIPKVGKFAFYNCKDVKSVSIPENITEIGEGAFYGCSLTGKINLPNSISFIGERAFNGNDIEGVVIPEGNATYKNAGSGIVDVKTKTLISAFNDTTIPTDGSVTRLGGFAFSGCDKITSITVPDCITFMGAGVFENCTAMTSVTLPKDLKYLNARTFAGCTSLTEIALPETVERIGISAFRDCTKLSSINLHEGIYEVKDFAFANCVAMTSLTLPSTVKELGKGITSGCIGMTSLDIKSGSSYWSGNNCIFKGNTVVTAISNSVIPDNCGLTKLEAYAFQNFTNLESVYLPSGMGNIGELAFDGCDALKTVDFGGDEAEFKKVMVAAGNDAFTKASVNCNAEAPAFFAGQNSGTASGEGSEDTSDSNLLIWLIVGGAVLLIGGAAAVFFIVKSKKKTQE